VLGTARFLDCLGVMANGVQHSEQDNTADKRHQQGFFGDHQGPAGVNRGSKGIQHSIANAERFGEDQKEEPVHAPSLASRA